jgi:hypothetical protein
MAQRRLCAVKMVRHINKSRNPQAIFRGGGSIGFSAACRLGWLVANDPLHPDRKVLAQVKNNLAPPQPSLAYQIERQESGWPKLHWLGPCSWTANQLLATLRPLLGQVELAREFLVDFLATGPRTSREIIEAAHKRDLAKSSLDKARARLQITSDRGRICGQQVSFWCLPGQESPLQTRDPDWTDFDEFLKRYREQYQTPPPDDE